ncbi:MAG TPA: glycosyltransferase, partial [Candidatus Moranbacteria bacterium]|nr:glycosyltransferase [Candidatus Moranbacteria bacterium]
MKKPSKNWVVYLSTFPPRECGIATFTKDLVDAFNELFFPEEEAKVVAMNVNELEKLHYPKLVIGQIFQNRKNEYVEAAQKINAMPAVKLVCIQHEFGIFGGECGEYLLEFLREIKKPVVIAMHTVLPSSNSSFEKYKKIVTAINDYVRCLVVMTKTSKKILTDDYGIPQDKIQIIPHGIHATPYKDSKKAKLALGLTGKKVVSTFGLLSEGKGIEYAIEAFSLVVKKFPDAVYLVVGATHPIILKREGEAYRNKLVELALKLGLDKNIIFFNAYFPTKKILQFLQATDIYLSTALDENQATSGTLSYALGAGRPVVSTAFAQAKEDVTEEVGRLVEIRNPTAMAQSINEIFDGGSMGIEMGKRAYFRTRKMTWQNVALSYAKKFIELVPELELNEKKLPEVKLEHLIKMTDDFGMFQFAKLTEPDRDSGYTLDDNARALIVTAKYYEKYKDRTVLKLAGTYLKFIEYVFVEPGFHNYVNRDKTFDIERNVKEGLDDAYARGIYALAFAAASKSLPPSIKIKAAKIFRKRFNLEKIVTAPRAAAFYIKALCKWLEYDKDAKYEEALKKYCQYLVELYEKNDKPDWQWFEDILAYSNGVLPEALLLAYKRLGDQKYFNIAKITLDFLILHSFKGDCCVPVGQGGWFERGGKKTLHDQQPEEV